MVKAVVGDEAHLKAFEDNLSSSAPPAQVGLVVGKLSASSDRALVYSLLPTPPTDAARPLGPSVPPLAPRPRPRAAVNVEAHLLPTRRRRSSSMSTGSPSTRQVSRMLLGGISVIGIYMWASEASFKATSPAVLAQVIKVVSQAVPCYGSGFDERLLIHISYSPRRWACRICEIASGRLSPCDFKYSKLLASLQTFRCTYNFEIRLTVVQAEPFKKLISKAISHLTKEVQNAKALIDGDLFLDDMNITSEGPHKVDFLVPFKNNWPAEDCSLEGVAGLLLFAGSVSAWAYLGPKESISEAISDLKLDIITSLRSRLDIILDEADDESPINDLENSPSQKATQVIFHELREPYSFSFPRRILIPWLSGSYVCDYLQQSETAEDAMERCKEVISLETDVESTSIVEPESAAASATLESSWDVVPGALSRAPAGASIKDGHSGQTRDSRRTQGYGSNIAAALLVLLVALLAGFIFTFSSANSKT